ncbi:hypothetical protein J6590_033266 [Homalodisca vitripennis]|nr:hypothetical protein J6590_033266 [Homalodisca vitripennis]
MESALVWWFATVFCLAVLRSSDGLQDSDYHPQAEVLASVELQNAEMPKEVMELLMKEAEIMTAIDNFLDKMVGHNQENSSKTEGENREEKSISITKMNVLDCDKKHCDNHHEDTEQDTKQGNEHDKNISDMVFLVYPEILDKKNETYDERTHIILPSKEPMEKLWNYEKDNSNKNQEIDLQEEASKQIHTLEVTPMNIGHGVNESINTDQIPQSKRNKPDLHKLFPNRRSQNSHSKSLTPINKTPQQDAQEIIEDSQTAASEIEEVQVGTLSSSPIVVMNLTDEQINNLKFPLKPIQPFTQQRKPLNEHTTKMINNNNFVPVRVQPRGSLRFTPQIQNKKFHTDEPTSSVQDVSHVMEEINIKAINGMLRSDFTGQPNSRKYLKATHNTDHTLIRDFVKDNPSIVNNQNSEATKTLNKQTSHLVSTAANLKNEESNSKYEITNVENNAEPKRSRFSTRGRSRQRQTTTTTPSTPTTSVPQEQTDNNSEKRQKYHRFTRRRQPQMISRSKSHSSDINVSSKQVQTDDSDNINSQERNKSTETSHYTGRRIQNRFKMTSRRTSPTIQRKPAEEEPIEQEITNTQPLQSTEIINPNSQVKLLMKKDDSRFSTSHHKVFTESSTNNEEFATTSRSTQLEAEDLEGIGNEVHHSVISPPRMERGFKPIIQSRALNIVGPIPGGFLDQSRLFSPSGDEIGLELPFPSSQAIFNSGDQFNDDEFTQDLLPPVFPPPRLTKPQFSTIHLETKTSPTQSPTLQPTTLNAMLSQHRDIAKLQRDFSSLKNQYDMLLKQYAETLRIYNEKYIELLS